MKRSIVLSAVLYCAAMLYAANPTDAPHLFCDFESPTTLPASAFHIPDGGAVEVSIVANPSKTGLNTSDHVLKITSPAGANWGGAIFNEVSHGQDLMMNVYGVHKVTGYDLVSFLMYRESNTHVPQLKTVDIDDDGHTTVNYLDLVPFSVDGDENYVANNTIKTHQWQKVVYNVTHCHNSGIHFIYIMPDRETSSTVYIDDIIFEKDDEKPVMVSASCTGTATGTTLSLAVSATDDLSNPVNRFLVATDGNIAHATEYKATNGVITITGLSPNTTYTFTVWAKDYAGNISDNFKTTTCSTEAPTQGDWCQKEITSGGHTIYVSCEDMGAYYRFTVESNEALYGFGGTFFNPGAVDLRTTIVSQTANKIVCEIYASSDPTFYTPLYVMMPDEVMFSALQNASITWGVCETVPPCVPTAGDTTATICASETFMWRGTAAHDGDQITLTNAAGCDSVVTLHLVTKQPTTGSETQHVCTGSSYYWYGVLAHDGDTRTLTNAAGCDSVVTLHLIEDSYTTSDTAAAKCDPMTWYEHTCNATNDYTHTFVGGSSMGCDSIITLHFTLLTASAGDTTATICAGETFMWRGAAAHDGDQITLTNAAGCDSVVTLHLIEEDCTIPCEDIIMRKWNDLLFVNNGDSLFVSYQWYQDGQPLSGETAQYLYTNGVQLDGDGHEYSARAFKADGSYVVACAMLFNEFQSSAELNPGDGAAVHVYPNPVIQRMPVTIMGLDEAATIRVYNAAGQLMTTHAESMFIADLPAGCYLLYSTSAGVPWCGMLIVK